MANFSINLNQKNIATIFTDEQQLNLKIQYDANATFNDEGEIIVIVEKNLNFLIFDFAVAENILYSKIVEGTEYARKYLIKIVIDKSIQDDGKYFISCLATDIDIEELKKDFSNDYILTAKNIVNLSENPETSESLVKLSLSGEKFYVQTNAKEYVVAKNYVDWVINATGTDISTMMKVTTTFTSNQTTAITTFKDDEGTIIFNNDGSKDGYDRPIYRLFPYVDFFLQSCNFYAAQAREFWATTGGLVTSQIDRFGFIIDASSLDNEFVSFTITNLHISALAVNATTALSGTGKSGVGTIHPSCSFKVWKSWTLGETNRDQIMFSIPLTNISVTSLATQCDLEKLQFWINNSGWYFGNYNDQSLMYKLITESYDINGSTNIVQIDDAIDGKILPLSFAVMNPAVNNNNLNNTIVRFDLTDLENDVTFTLKLALFGADINRTIKFYSLLTPAVLIYELLSENADPREPYFPELEVEIINKIIKIRKPVIFKNRIFYDWNFDSKESVLSPQSIMSLPSKTFSGTSTATLTKQRAALNFPPLDVSVVAFPESNLRIENITFYTAKASMYYFSSSTIQTPSFTSYKYLPKFSVDLTNITTKPIQITLKNCIHYQGIPRGSSYMYPLSVIDGATTTSRTYACVNPSIDFIYDYAVFDYQSSSLCYSKLKIDWKVSTFSLYIDVIKNFIVDSETRNNLNLPYASTSSSSNFTNDITKTKGSFPKCVLPNQTFYAVKNTNPALITLGAVYFTPYKNDDFLNIWRRVTTTTFDTIVTDANKLIFRNSASTTIRKIWNLSTETPYTFKVRLRNTSAALNINFTIILQWSTPFTPITSPFTKTYAITTQTKSNVQAWDLEFSVNPATSNYANLFQYIDNSIQAVNFT